MYEAVISFLNSAARLPGCSALLSLREALEQSRYRRNASNLKAKAQIDKFENARAAGKELFKAAKDKLPGNAAAMARETPGVVPSTHNHPSRTVLMPRPGGRKADVTAVAPPAPTLPVATMASRGSGINALIDAGSDLFILVGELRNMPTHTEVFHLRQEVARRIDEFDATVRSSGVPHEHVIAARYAMCTLLDETVLSTPWGADSEWGRHSLLSQFHNETWGGEKFFHMVDRVRADASRHLPLLEFLYLCMALGLEGKYRVIDDGRSGLGRIRERVYASIRQVRGDFERELSPRWKGAESGGQRLVQPVPLWVVAAMSGTLLLAAYLAFDWSLARSSDPVRAQLARIGVDARQAVVVPPVERTETLREALAEDIRGGLIDVTERSRGSTIALRGDGLFASGSAQVDPRLVPLLERIATALNRFPGPVHVTGHSDNQPLSAVLRARYPSNWDLSQARADAVAGVLHLRLDERARMSAEGRGDSEPRVPNDTPEQRARNRRVEITLLGPNTRPVDTQATSASGNATPRNPDINPNTTRENQS